MSSDSDVRRVPLQALAEHWGKRSSESALDTVHGAMSVDKLILGDMRYEPIKKGAMVISVDGESEDKGSQMNFEKISYLGRFVGMKMVNPYFYRVYFTTRNGYYESKATKVERIRKIQHPLSRKGFLVPARSGIKVFDKGLMVLVSRIGIFEQIDGYKIASQHLRDLVKERQRSDHYQNLHEEAVIKLDTMSEELHDTYLRNVSMGEQVRTLMQAKTELTKQRETAEGMLKSMKSKTEMSVDVLEHTRRLFEEELSKYTRYISDVLLTIERAELEDSYRAGRSTHPVLRQQFERDIINKWKKDGIIKDNEAELLNSRMARMEQAIREAEERDAHEEVDRQSEEGVAGDDETDDGGRLPAGSKGLAKTGQKDGGIGRDNILSGTLSKIGKGAGKTFDELNRLRERNAQQQEEQEAQGETEEADGEDSGGDEET